MALLSATPSVSRKSNMTIKVKLFKALILLFMLVLILSCDSEIPSPSLKVMTFNIRLNLASDGANAWPNRREMTTSMIRFYAPDIFGVQEALLDQVTDLEKRLLDYSWIGVGRDDGREAGEFMAIYFLKDRFELLDQATFWLSETPEIPSLGWDAGWIRVVTWGHFTDLHTGKTFYHFNTHLDSQGEQARQAGARLLLSKMKSITASEPVVLTGDFNADPTSKAYEIVTQGVNGGGFKLIDSQKISQHPHHGPKRTFNGFDLNSLKTEVGPIDYIFVQNRIDVLKHATLSDTFHGFFPSDHMPVYAELSLAK